MTAEHGDHSAERHLVGVDKQTRKAVLVNDKLHGHKLKVNAQHQQRQTEYA